MTLYSFKLILIIVFCSFVTINSVIAEEKITVKGEIKSYNLEDKTLVLTVEGDQELIFFIKDAKALKMLDNKLTVGDRVRIRYYIEENKNIITSPQDLRSIKPGC